MYRIGEALSARPDELDLYAYEVAEWESYFLGPPEPKKHTLSADEASQIVKSMYG